MTCLALAESAAKSSTMAPGAIRKHREAIESPYTTWIIQTTHKMRKSVSGPKARDETPRQLGPPNEARGGAVGSRRDLAELLYMLAPRRRLAVHQSHHHTAASTVDFRPIKGLRNIQQIVKAKCLSNERSLQVSLMTSWGLVGLRAPLAPLAFHTFTITGPRTGICISEHPGS
jgi:hypothetical protein